LAIILVTVTCDKEREAKYNRSGIWEGCNDEKLAIDELENQGFKKQ
jgi:hypothetical protein